MLRRKVLARAIIALAVGVPMLFTAIPARADETPNPGSGYLIQLLSTGTCLDVTGASTADGALVQLWDCGLGWNQQWIFEPYGVIAGRQSYRIHVRHVNKCLDVANAASAGLTTRMIIFQCHDGWNQRFWLNTDPVHPAYTNLQAAYSPLAQPWCVDGSENFDNLHASGFSAKLWVCNPYGTEFQRWALTVAG